MMPQVLKVYRNAGYRFVSLPEAERDPAYAGYTNLKLSPPLSQQQLADQRHVRLAAAPDYSARLNSICL
jgi:hypothetical protein